MKKLFTHFETCILASLILVGCNTAQQEKTTMSSTTALWGKTDNQEVYLYTLTNQQGTVVKISNYGATITEWITADQKGNLSNIVLGFDSLQNYLDHPPYFGAIIGRYGNRIANAQFQLGNKTYQLAANNGKNHLHGGNKGFDKVVWNLVQAPDSTNTILFSYLSKDGEEGYPGNLKITVSYQLTEQNELKINYTAVTDQPTPVNLTNHSYFNLTGSPTNTILDHQLQINADAYTPVDSTLIPTGKLAPVTGTPFDFKTPHKIGERIQNVTGGYDHNFVLSRKGNSLELVSTLADSISGRTLEVYTTEPGLQFYSGNFLDGKLKTSKGIAIQQHAALCLETQHFPNSPNQSNFPSTILQPGETYHTSTIYKIIVSKH